MSILNEPRPKPPCCFWCGHAIKDQRMSSVKAPQLSVKIFLHGNPHYVTGEDCCAKRFELAFKAAAKRLELPMNSLVDAHLAYRIYVTMLKAHPKAMPFLHAFLDHSKEVVKSGFSVITDN